MTWLDEARGWAEETGRDIKRRGEGLVRTYRPVVERAAADAEARLRAHRAAMEKVGWLADLARAPKKGERAAAPKAAPSTRVETPAQVERRAMVDRAIPFPLAAAINPMGFGAPGVFPAVIDTNGKRREVSDEEFFRRIPAEMRPMLKSAEAGEYGNVKPDRFTGPDRHLNMRISDVGVTDPQRLGEAMKMYPAPGVDRNGPVRTGDYSLVGNERVDILGKFGVPLGAVPGGWVQHWIPKGTQAVVNETVTPHVFHRGIAGRLPSQNPDGTTRITTVSVGTNGVTGSLNQAYGPGQFGELDKRIASAARPRGR